MAEHHEITDHTLGEMDISQQQQTFHGFLNFSKWVIILSLAALVFIALVNG